ncbi:uncharacterized protein LOC113296490 [Papaver somniferum]|uniref:uncharacterized protein LOC113296490 n=1 Tax=Papaver somniferum TaxID=3469 RepID=UPI000E700A07|nr:uncharacterized protein LOC113296490 [Papaver somniferum]
MTPFQDLYGYQLPHLAFPLHSTTFVQVVQDYLYDRDHMLQMLREDLLKVQTRMKFFSDKHRTDRTFAVGDMVFLKLQPYRQTSVAIRKNFKLSSKYFRPFEIVQRIGVVVYELKLPVGSRIHPVFHVSQLKMKIGHHSTSSPSLPLVDQNGAILEEPAAVLATRITLRDGHSIPQVLIQWVSAPAEDATWEDTSHIRDQFPHFVLEDKDS